MSTGLYIMQTSIKTYQIEDSSPEQARDMYDRMIREGEVLGPCNLLAFDDPRIRALGADVCYRSTVLS